MTNEYGPIRIIWIALAMSVVFYGTVAYMIIPVDTQPFGAAFSNPVVLALHIAGLGMFAMAHLASSFVRTGDNLRMAMIVRWAMIESAAIFGLVAAFLAQDLRLFIPLAALAIAGMVMAYPRE